MAEAHVRAKISLSNAAFLTGLRSVTGGISSLAGIAARVGPLLAAVGAPISVAAFASGIKGALDYGSSLTDLANRTGAPIKDLVVLQQAFKMSGINAESVGPSINKLQKALAGVNEDGEQTSPIFQKLGLNMNDLLSKSPVEQFNAVGAAIAALPDANERAAASMKIFGRSGGELLALFRDPAVFGQAAQLIGSQAGIFERMAPLFDRISDVLGSWPEKLRGFFAGFAEGIAPQLSTFAEFFAGIDLAPLGAKLGAALNSGLDILRAAIAQGKTTELLGLAFEVVISKASDAFVNAMTAAFSVIKEVGIKALAEVGKSGANSVMNALSAINPALFVANAFRKGGSERAEGTSPEGPFISKRTVEAEAALKTFTTGLNVSASKVSEFTARSAEWVGPMQEVFESAIGPGGTIAGGPAIPEETPQETALESFATKISAASRLESIGGLANLAGGSQNSALGYAARTATAIEEVRKGFERGIKITYMGEYGTGSATFAA